MPVRQTPSRHWDLIAHAGAADAVEDEQTQQLGQHERHHAVLSCLSMEAGA